MRFAIRFTCQRLRARRLIAGISNLTDEGLLVCEIGGSQEEFLARYPDIPVAWPEFEKGGDGVFVINRDELLAWLDTRGY